MIETVLLFQHWAGRKIVYCYEVIMISKKKLKRYIDSVVEMKIRRILHKDSPFSVFLNIFKQLAYGMSRLPDGYRLNPDKWATVYAFFKGKGEDEFMSGIKSAISSVIKEKAHAKAEYIRGNLSKDAAQQANANLENAIIDLREFLGYHGTRPIAWPRR